MFTYHYLQPEKQWGVFEDGVFVTKFEKMEAARDYCARQNAMILASK